MAQNWLRHAMDRSGWQPQSQVTALVVLGVMITLIFGGVYLSQVASFATTTREIEVLLSERDRLEFTNEQLRAEIANLQTVPRLLARAQELGFRPATSQDIEYYVIDGYNPDRAQTVVVPRLEDEEFQAAPRYDATFSGWLQQNLESLQEQFERFGAR